MAYPNAQVNMLMPDNSVAVKVQLGVIDVDFITKEATVSVDAFNANGDKVYTFKFPRTVDASEPIPNHEQQWEWVLPAIREYELTHPVPQV